MIVHIDWKPTASRREEAETLTQLAAGFNWDGAAHVDPVAALHHAIENSTFEVSHPIVLSEWEFQRYEMWRLARETMSYRVRTTAWSLWRAANLLHERRDRRGPLPNAERCFVRARSLEPKATP